MDAPNVLNIQQDFNTNTYEDKEDSLMEQPYHHDIKLNKSNLLKHSMRTKSVDNIYYKTNYAANTTFKYPLVHPGALSCLPSLELKSHHEASQQGDGGDLRTRSDLGCQCCDSVAMSTSTSSSTCAHEPCHGIYPSYHNCDASRSSSCTCMDNGSSHETVSQFPSTNAHRVYDSTIERTTQAMNSSSITGTIEINRKTWSDPMNATALVQPRISYATLDLVSLLKYRVQYPELLAFVQQCTQLYVNKRITCCIPVLNKINLAKEVLVKRLKRNFSSQSEKEGRMSFVEDDRVENRFMELTRMQLWKRRYYILLTAVDFVYKDYQLLHHVSKESLFGFLSDIPPLPSHVSCKFKESFGRVSIDRIKDVHCLAITSADPSSYLTDRVTQLLVITSKTNGNEGHPKVIWPCSFAISISLLSDVIAQSRLLRQELDRRLKLQDRLLYVLRQARSQRTKLTTHLSRQREYCITLQSRLLYAHQRLTTASPIPDCPASINEGVIHNIASPFVEPEAGDTEHFEKITSKVVHSNDDMVECTTPRIIVEPDITQLRDRIVRLRNQIVSLERVLKEEESRRKRLHNRIQELTGNIRVFCRLRPNETVPTFAGHHDDQHQQQPPRKDYLHVSSDDKLLFSVNALKESVRGHIRNNLPGMSLTGGTGGSSMSRTTTNSSPYVSNNQPVTVPKCFIFDRVFGPAARQDEVYKEVDDLVVSCIDGYNVCIMAYGQTGSGKTYTMMGTSTEPGVNRQAVQHLYARCNKRKNWKYSVFISMVEIYQEDLFDLLEYIEEEQPALFSKLAGSRKSATNPGQQISKKVISFSHQKEITPWNTWTTKSNHSAYNHIPRRRIRRRGSVRILSDNLDGVVLQNLQEHHVDDENDMLQYLELAETQRRVGSTRLNICSSRSHLVILLRVVGEYQLDMKSTRGTLTLADLAGSENVTKSGSTGERFLEAACINKSLSSLGRVFDALRRQQKPTYRETKLTYLLKPNLSGESKCLLFVALRTEPEHAEETWRAVHFGQGAIQVIPGSGTSTSNEQSDFGCHRVVRNSPAGKKYPPLRLPSPATPVRPFRTSNVTKAFTRSNPGEGHNFLPHSVYNMGPTITKRGWRYALGFYSNQGWGYLSKLTGFAYKSNTELTFALTLVYVMYPFSR